MHPRLTALFFLAWSLLRTTVRRLVSARRGLSVFRENYAADGLGPLTAEQRRLMPTFGSCIACGRCNVGDGPVALRAAGRFPGTMSLVLAAPRSMPEYQASASAFGWLSEEQLRDKQALCPTGVPLVEIAGFVREQAKSARVSEPRRRGP